MSKDQSASRSDGELLEDVDYILAKLDQRVLTTDGGKADPMVHHWNLTEGDSAMHREAAAHIRALVEKLAAVRSERPFIPEGCTVADAQMLREANHTLAAENHALRRCLRWYANGEHYTGLLHWEGPSGEDENWLCPPIADDLMPEDRAEFIAKLDEAMVEDGGVARATLVTGKFEIDPENEPKVVQGEPEWIIEQAAQQGDKDRCAARYLWLRDCEDTGPVALVFDTGHFGADKARPCNRPDGRAPRVAVRHGAANFHAGSRLRRNAIPCSHPHIRQ